jgi:addiction module RelB/DinJ family antitoxin
MLKQANYRIDSDLKGAGDAIIESYGMTPSQAVRALWGYIADTGGLPPFMIDAQIGSPSKTKAIKSRATSKRNKEPRATRDINTNEKAARNPDSTTDSSSTYEKIPTPQDRVGLAAKLAHVSGLAIRESLFSNKQSNASQNRSQVANDADEIPSTTYRDVLYDSKYADYLALDWR